MIQIVTDTFLSEVLRKNENSKLTRLSLLKELFHWLSMARIESYVQSILVEAGEYNLGQFHNLCLNAVFCLYMIA